MKNCNVLVVEDDHAIRRLLVECLNLHSSLVVDSARDGIEALHQITVKCYAVIVLDVMMPKMSGVDFLHSLKAMATDPSVKSLNLIPAVIVITGAAESVLPNETMRQHFPDHVTHVLRKPLNMPELARAVEEQLNR